MYRDNGVLEVYSLPDLRLSYLIRNFGFGQNVLHDSMEFTTLQNSSSTEPVAPEVQVINYCERQYNILQSLQCNIKINIFL